MLPNRVHRLILVWKSVTSNLWRCLHLGKKSVWYEQKFAIRMNDAWSSRWIWYCEFFENSFCKSICAYFSLNRSIAYLCHSNDVNNSQRNQVYELQIIIDWNFTTRKKKKNKFSRPYFDLSQSINLSKLTNYIKMDDDQFDWMKWYQIQIEWPKFDWAI